MRNLMLLATGACLAASASAAPLIVDDFTSLTPQSLSVMGSGVDSTYMSGGTMLGGSRALAIGSASDYGLESRWDIVPGAAAVSDHTGNSGIFWLGYMAVAASGGWVTYSTATDYNFAYDAIEVDMLSSDKPFTLRARLYSDAGDAIWEKAVGAIAAPTTITISSADLVFGSVDAANLDLLIVEFETMKDGDLGLSEIRAVPEPATMATLGLGAFALIRKRRRA